MCFPPFCCRVQYKPLKSRKNALSSLQHLVQGLRARRGHKVFAVTGISNISFPFRKGVTNTLGDKQK